ncbi:MAG: hypothetical protein WC184_06870 [Acidimicrobiia bacterium]
MSDTEEPIPLPDLPGAPYDIEFFFDPGCPFAWQTSVWIRRVAELESVRVGWRFISLKFLNEDSDEPTQAAEGRMRGLRFHRICAAVRERFGNEAVGNLYKAYGERFWYQNATGTYLERAAFGAQAAKLDEILDELALPQDLLTEADNESYDQLIRAETDGALARTGAGVGTPIITFDPPHGNSLFGPVISSVPDDDTAVEFYRALRVFADFPDFSELKRTKRPPLDLPLYKQD